jgi:hypothetical protein
MTNKLKSNIVFEGMLDLSIMAKPDSDPKNLKPQQLHWYLHSNNKISCSYWHLHDYNYTPFTQSDV